VERIDDIDARIVTMLQARGRLKRNEMAEAVGLSVPAVSERMRKLEERGVITGYHAVVDPKRLHLDVTVFIRVSLDTSQHFDAFVEQAVAHPEVLEVHSITGEGSHMLKVRTRSTSTLERLLAQVQQWPGVRATSTSIVLSSFKETRAVSVSATTLHEPA